MNRFPAFVLAACFLGCSFGPPNLAPILHDPGTDTRPLALLGLSTETARGYRQEHRDAGNTAGNRMEFLSFRPSMAGAISARGLLFVPFVHNLFLNPGLGAGIKADGFYGLLAADFAILRAGELGFHSPHLGGQLGARLARYAIATYDFAHVTYMDLYGTGYGVASRLNSERAVSKLGIAFGDGIYFVPSLLYVHGADRIGMGIALIVAPNGNGGRF